MVNSFLGGQGIVSLDKHERQRRLAPLRVLEAYWRGLCDRDMVPLRSEIDPRGIENQLEQAFLVERIAPTMAKLRVAGSHLTDLMGMEMAGMPLSSMIVAEDRDRIGEAIGRFFADPAILHLSLEAVEGLGKPALSGDMVLLPLRSDFGDVTRGIGAIVTHGRIGRAPRRFALRSVQVLPALGGEQVADGATPGNRPEHAGMEDPRRPFDTKKHHESPAPASGPTESPAREGKAHLKLIISND